MLCIIHAISLIFKIFIRDANINLKPTLGRKNYLFCGNHSAAEDAAVIYSLFGCCKACDVNFYQWLVYILNNIHSYDLDYAKDLAELLPAQVKKHLTKIPESLSLDSECLTDN